MVIKVSVSRQAPVQFYEAENNIEVKLPLVDDVGAPLTGTPSAGYPKLFVDGLASSPITLIKHPTVPGLYHFWTVAAQWATVTNDPIKFYEAYIEWRDDTGLKVLTDAFTITTVKAPTLSL